MGWDDDDDAQDKEGPPESKEQAPEAKVCNTANTLLAKLDGELTSSMCKSHSPLSFTTRLAKNPRNSNSNSQSCIYA
jgi:hypothetical protein